MSSPCSRTHISCSLVILSEADPSCNNKQLSIMIWFHYGIWSNEHSSKDIMDINKNAESFLTCWYLFEHYLMHRTGTQRDSEDYANQWKLTVISLNFSKSICLNTFPERFHTVSPKTTPWSKWHHHNNYELLLWLTLHFDVPHPATVTSQSIELKNR